MDIRMRKIAPLKAKTPCLVLGAFEGKVKTPLLKELDQVFSGSLSRAVRDKEFTGKFRQTLLLHSGDRLPAERVLLVGLGKEKGAGVERLRQAAGVAAKWLQDRSISSWATNLPAALHRGATLAERVQGVVEGAALACYSYNRYRTEKVQELPPPLKKLQVIVEAGQPSAQVEQAIACAQHTVRSVHWARDLVNSPGNLKSPHYMAQRAREMAVEVGLGCTILDRDQLEAEGMGALLGVAQGSVREPRLVVLEHRGGNKGSRPIVLVGKGVVFDAGGISLKPAEKMDEMKMDMAGGAAVLGALMGAALLKLPVNVVGIVPLVENLPSGSAIRPGDILTSLSGRTIEVLNTDAEGRLILADALTYAKRFEPHVVIDVATLTGACIVALGHHASAILGNHDGLARLLTKAGEKTGERLWRLPLWEDYAAQLKSEVADLKNIGGRPAGTITAAAFLQTFAEEMTWAHLDIAGTAWEEKGRPYIPKGGTGVGVRLLLNYLGKIK